MPEGLRRRMDVTDFGTPVKLITTAPQGDRVRMVIDNKGDWEHSAYQRDNQFVVEVREKKIDTSKLVDGPQFSGEKLSPDAKLEWSFKYLDLGLFERKTNSFFIFCKGPN